MASNNQFITMQTLSSAASSAGQTNTLNVPGTPTATVVQVGTKGAVSSGQHAIIQQNGQQFILTGKILTSDQTEQGPSEAISLPNNPQTVQTVYPVQYIDTSDPTIYTTGNGQIEYIEINSGKPVTKAILTTSGSGSAAIKNDGQYQEYAPMYATPVTAAAYYQTNGDPINVGQVGNSGTQSTNSVQGLSAGTQIVTHQGNTFLVQGTAASLDGESAAITHTTRASPATVQWLIDNYETAEGVSLPRSTLYNHYLRHCQEQKIDPMNPASFGKLIRSVFLGLRTRRLGTRGNSKYHYYGIRIKPTSSLNQFSDDQIYPSIRHYPHAYHKQNRYKAFNGPKFEPSGSTSDYNSHVGTTNNIGSSALGVGSSSGPSAVGSGTSTSAGNGPVGFGNNVSDDPTQHQQFLGDASSALPQFADIMIPEGMSLPPGITKDNLENFTEMYQEHCEMILDSVVNLQFTMVEQLWQQFWRISPPQVVGSMMNIDMNSNDSDTERRLQKDTLYLLIEFEPVRQYVRRCDYTFYHSLVEVLIPDVLRPIPSSLTQAIRNFAKSLEGWMRSCFKGLGKLLSLKLAPVCALAQTLRRYTSLNHLAQAARAVLQNTSQINQMLTDLNRVDFANVQEQASWVAHCSDATVTQIEQNFKKILQQQTSLEQWATWLDEVVTTVLHPHEKKPEFPRAARQFLLKWSFYSSMVIRDLTLRSAASFGSFHLIRLLYDEYMFYLIEHKVADHLGQPPVAVMGEFGKTHDNAEVPNTRMETFDSPTVNSTNSATGGGNMTNVSGAAVMGNVNPTGLSTSGSSGVSGDHLNLSNTSELLATPNLSASVMIVSSTAATSGHNQPPNMASSGLISLGQVASTITTSASGTISHSDAVAIKENDFQDSKSKKRSKDLLAQHELVDNPGRDSPPTVAASGLTTGVSGIQSVSFPKSVTVTTGDEGQSIQVLLHGPTVSAAISAAGGQTSSTSTSALNAAIVPSVGTSFTGNIKSSPSVAIGSLSANDATTVIAGKRIKLAMGD